MKLEPSTSGVIGRCTNNLVTEMSKIIPNLTNIQSRTNPDQTD